MNLKHLKGMDERLGAPVCIAMRANEGESNMDYYARTASALLTGFFFGTFITLCVVSPHRREIANVFT